MHGKRCRVEKLGYAPTTVLLFNFSMPCLILVLASLFRRVTHRTIYREDISLLIEQLLSKWKKEEIEDSLYRS